MRSIHLLLVLITSALLAGLHIFALQEYLYWRFFWYDIMMHALGGFLVALAYLWFARYVVPSKLQNVFRNLTASVAFVVIVGLLWEAFEVVYNLQPDYTFDEWLSDSSLDMVMDVLGGILAFVFVRRLPNG